MDLLSGYASSDDDEQGAAEHVQPRPAPVAAAALPNAATLFATSLPAGQHAVRCDLAVSRTTALRSGSRVFHRVSEPRTVSNLLQMRAAKSVQPSALCYARSNRKVRAAAPDADGADVLRRHAPGQRATAAPVPVRRAGEAMLPPQLRGRCVLCARVFFDSCGDTCATGATSRLWTWTPWVCRGGLT